MNLVHGRVFLLTGAAGGIGRALACALHGRGAHLVATDLDLDALRTLATEDGWEGATLRALDVRDPEAWQRVVDETLTTWGRIDVLINNAGFLRPGHADAVSSDDIALHLDVNVKGVQLGTRAVLPGMLAAGAGHLVHVGSLASLSPVPGLPLYTASKFAVRGFALSTAAEVHARGVATTLLMPDAVETPMLELQRDRPEAAMTFSGSGPLTPDDIVDAFLRIVLPHRPLELALPLHRGVLARAAALAPGLLQPLIPLFVERGRRRQRR